MNADDVRRIQGGRVMDAEDRHGYSAIVNHDTTVAQSRTAFWDQRAALGPLAGTQDRIAKELEMRVISSYVSPTPGQPFMVRDFGCGDGETLIRIASAYDRADLPVLATGFDTSDKMLEAALRKKQGLTWCRPAFYRLDVRTLWEDARRAGHLYHWLKAGCDLAYTERTLINLQSWPEQQDAIRNIISTLKPGGLYVMVENFQGPLARLNQLRQSLGLAVIAAPEHNLYLDETALTGLDIPEAYLVDVRRYSDVYYFLSRVVNAYQAMLRGESPDYYSPINRLALRLPPWEDFVPHVGQGQCWVWRKR